MPIDLFANVYGPESEQIDPSINDRVGSADKVGSAIRSKCCPKRGDRSFGVSKCREELFVCVLIEFLPERLRNDRCFSKLIGVYQPRKFIIGRHRITAAPLLAIDGDRLAAASQYLVEAAYLFDLI